MHADSCLMICEKQVGGSQASSWQPGALAPSCQTVQGQTRQPAGSGPSRSGWCLIFGGWGGGCFSCWGATGLVPGSFAELLLKTSSQEEKKGPSEGFGSRFLRGVLGLNARRCPEPARRIVLRHLFVSASSQSTVCRRQTFNEGQFAQLISQRRKPFDKKSISHDINPLLFITRQISPPNSLKYAASRLGAQISPVSHSLMATCETYAQHHPDDRAARAFPRGCRVGFWGQRRSYSPGDSSRRAGVCARGCWAPSARQECRPRAAVPTPRGSLRAQHRGHGVREPLAGAIC